MWKLVNMVPFVVFPIPFSVVLSNSIFQPPTQLSIHQFYISWCVKLKGKERVDEICIWWSNFARSIALKSLWSFTSIGFVLSFTGGFSKHCNRRMLRQMDKQRLPPQNYHRFDKEKHGGQTHNHNVHEVLWAIRISNSNETEFTPYQLTYCQDSRGCLLEINAATSLRVAKYEMT